MSTNIGLSLILIFCLSMKANALLIDVEFQDNDGPQWKGTVNTKTDELTITSWSEGAGAITWWTPLSPLTWVARDFSGNKYDVLDNWDGSLVDFGFLSDDMLSELSWHDGIIEGASSGWTTVRPGWGITSMIGLTGYEEFYQGGGNTWLGFLPQGDNPMGAARTIADSVSFIARVEVPEPSSLTLLLLGITGVLVRRKQNG
ncbi:PEP-CTERM sorting domain-containing protein [Teredinibacter sp. KSP-S5-2]|uniref:PEP-CTERM sorting domain-containing protein n=1 Tax=Teredinibacter sp. KSP-S5-2 TaxID=3034506 RepID=UPI002934238E|nr:PEP-CTERM sorting domain-containing protein [Teredinibacter sp. KSP-S5-2]WNO11613.1 PEP-CTERM sorting domain-containing protein [Teredinibacter sp. KSP-S5-2]